MLSGIIFFFLAGFRFGSYVQGKPNFSQVQDDTVQAYPDSNFSKVPSKHE